MIGARVVVLGILLGVGGCCHTPETPPPVSPAPCLVDAPPVLPKVTLAGPDEGCPPEFEACLSFESAAALAWWTRRSERWSRLAWARCAPTPPQE